MQSKVKLTKRQVKEDKFTTFMLTSKDQLQQYWQFYVIGLVAIVLVVAVVAYYFSYQSESATEAHDQLSRAMLDYRSGDSQIAILGLTKILEEHGGSDVADQATYMLGVINLEQKNYDEARRHFDLYLKNYHDSLFRAGSLGGLASLAEDQGDFAQAADYFVQAADEYPDGPSRADYEWGAFRNFLASGDTEAAKQHLSVLEQDYVGSVFTRRALILAAEKGLS